MSGTLIRQPGGFADGCMVSSDPQLVGKKGTSSERLFENAILLSYIHPSCLPHD